MITRDEIIRMAREAGLEKYHLPDSMMEYEFDRCVERFAHAAYAAGAAAEREAILREAHPAHYVDGHCEIVPVAAIRARSEK